MSSLFFKKRTMLVFLYFDTSNLGSANFSRIVITILVVCGRYTLLLTPQHSHITFLP